MRCHAFALWKMLKKCRTIEGPIVRQLKFGILYITTRNLYFVLNGDCLFLNDSFSSCLISVKNLKNSCILMRTIYRLRKTVVAISLCTGLFLPGFVQSIREVKCKHWLYL